MINFKRVSAAVLAGMALMCASGVSHGLGFGHPSSRAILGDTLRVTAPLRLEPGDEIANECVAADVYFGDEKVAPKSVRAEVLPGTGLERTLKVSTSIAVNEPVVTVYLAAGCQARITRKVIVLADPPGITGFSGEETSPQGDAAQAAQAAAFPVTNPVVQPAALQTPEMTHSTAGRPTASLAAGQPRNKAKSKAGAPASLAGAPSLVVAGVVARPEGAQAPVQRPAKTLAKSPAANAAPAEGGRLLLDPVDADAMVMPALRMSATLGAPVQAEDQSPAVVARREAAAAVWLALNASPEQMVRDRQRLQELEQRLTQLKQEGEQARQTVTTLQTQLSKAESTGGGKWFYLMGVLLLAALALAGYLYRKLRHEQRRSESWWHSQPDASSHDADSDAGHTSTEFVHVPDRVEPGEGAAATPPHRFSTPVAAMASEPHKALATADLHRMVPDAPRAPTAMPPGGDQHDEPLREVSVEELIDLEQQAEFFVVLGQDDAAIDLLESHVYHTTGASPMPFLKLLETYRRVGRRADYERVQAEFNQRFNAYAPSWDADLQHGHSLEDYPGVIERLQSLWSTPHQAMGVLEKSLTRPDSGADTFELPAYRELLFLYAVARDLSERDAGGRQSVDLLLPVIDVAAPEPPVSVHAGPIIEPLMATRPIKAQPEVSPSISLDLQLDDLQAPEPDHKP